MPRRRRSSSTPSSAAPSRCRWTAPAVGVGNVTVRVSGPGGFALERSYALGGEAGDADPRAPHGADRRARREPSRCRTTCSPTWCRAPAACRCRSGCRPRSTPRRCSRRSTAIRSAAPSRSPAARCRCSTSTTSRAPRIWRSTTPSTSASRKRSTGLLSRQGSNGSFGLWSVGGDDVWLDAYVTDFLTRARERNFAVPDVAFQLALQRLRNFVGQCRGPRPQRRRAISPMRSMCWRATAPRRSAICATSSTPSSTISRPRSPRRSSPRRSACSATRSRAERVYTAALRSMAPRADARIRPRRLRLDPARRRGADHARLGRRRAARRPSPARSSASRPRAGSRPTPRRRRMRGWCWRRARSPRTPPACRSTSPARSGRARSTGASCRASCSSRCAIANAGEAPLQAVVTVNGAPLAPEPAADRGFKIERLYFTLDGKPADPSKAKQNDRFVVVLRDHRAAAAVRPRHRRRLSAGRLRDRQSAARLVRRDRHAVLDRGRRDAGELGVPRRPLQRGVQPQERRSVGVHRRLCRAGGVAGHLRASAGLRRGHVPSRPLRPHRRRARSR